MIGYSFFEDGKVTWRMTRRVIMPLSPPHITKDVKCDTARRILYERDALLIRWERGFDMSEKSEWWHVIKDETEDIGRLPKKTRYYIRRSSELYGVKKCSRDTILDNGYNVYSEAYRRYSTHEKKYGINEYRKAIEELPDETEFWMVFRKDSGEMAGFAENIVKDSVCAYISIWLIPEDMKKFCGYLLIHEMNKHYLNHIGLRYISNGTRNISHETGIHDFLISKFKFRKAYSKLYIVYTPLLYFGVNILLPFRRIIAWFPGDVFKMISVLIFQERIRRSCRGLREAAR